MSKRFAFKLVCSVVGSLFSFTVQAFPISSLEVGGTAPNITVVRDFCGLGFHRSTHGHCIPNDASPLYPPPAPAPDASVLSACPAGYYHVFPYSGCIARACTFGYYLGPDGQCFPHWHPGI